MPIQKLQRQNQELSKIIFEREKELKLLNISMIAGLNTLFVGDPGGGKTFLVNLKTGYISDAKQFYKNMTSFTKPEEITGPMDLIQLKNGKIVINYADYLPGANIAKIDEAGRGQSVKSALLPLICENVFVNGGVVVNRPFKICDVFMSNTEFTNPDDEALDDRCHLRHFVERLQMKESWDLLHDLKKGKVTFTMNPNDMITVSELEGLRKQCVSMDTTQDLRDAMFEIMKRLEVEEKIYISPRTYEAGSMAVNAEAMLNGKAKAEIEDLSILLHVFALRKVNYMKVKKIVNSIANAELERLTVLFDNAENLHEEWLSKVNEADHRSYANKMKMIVTDFCIKTPSNNNLKFFQESVVRLKKLHGDMLEQAKKVLQKLSL